jgi:hypothetical protein
MFEFMRNTKTTPTAAARRSREQWIAEVERWRASGLGSAEYAAERGLKRGTLLWWSCKIGPASSEHTATGEPPAPVTFLPLRVREHRREAVAAASDASCIEVVLNNGRRVRVMGAVDIAQLTRVLGAVEGANRC